LKVTYYCGLTPFTDYLCVEHEGWAQRKARELWSKGTDVPMPPTTAEALDVASEVLKPVTHLRVWTNQKYPEVLGRCYDGTGFGAHEPTAPPEVDVAGRRGAVDIPRATPAPALVGTDWDDDIPF